MAWIVPSFFSLASDDFWTRAHVTLRSQWWTFLRTIWPLWLLWWRDLRRMAPWWWWLWRLRSPLGSWGTVYSSRLIRLWVNILWRRCASLMLHACRLSVT